MHIIVFQEMEKGKPLAPEFKSIDTPKKIAPHERSSKNGLVLFCFLLRNLNQIPLCIMTKM